ncbi:MAG: histidine kinase dimerization/phosphoacceptor domain -containing protein [Syntrophobacteraceae bacterium]
MGAGNLDHRIDLTGNDELAELAKASNTMAAKLKESHTSVTELDREIAERRRVEAEREITIELLSFINQSTRTVDLVRAAVTFFQNESRCEAVGIRLRDEEDYPYYEARGFPHEFVRLENSLCARDAFGQLIRDVSGNPYIECMCGNVICRRTDSSKPFFTSGGSFWANDTTRLLATTSDKDRQARTRNRCNGEGYDSVALIPLRVGAEPLGLIQLNDRRKNMFSRELIAMWERLAGYLAVGLAKSRTEEALRESESRYRELVQNANCAIIRWKPDGAITLFNEYARTFFGYSAEEAIGKNVSILVPDTEPRRDDLSSVIRDIVEHPESSHKSVQENVLRNGSRVWMVWTNTPMLDSDGKVKEILAVGTDITERKHVEDALNDSLAEKTALLKEVHHRVKNNLQIVASLLNLQSNRSTSREVIDVLRDTGNRVRSMSLLHETLYRSTSLAHIDFSTYVESLCEQLMASFGPAAKRVKVETRVARIGLPLECSVPCGLIVNELLSNALCHGFPDEREGRVVVELSRSDGGMLVLDVRDDGAGVPQDLDISTLSTLGLRLVSNLARQIGGELSVTSSEGGGSAFNVVFPVPAGTEVEERP